MRSAAAVVGFDGGFYQRSASWLLVQEERDEGDRGLGEKEDPMLSGFSSLFSKTKGGK